MANTTKKTEKKTVFLAELYRFGYDLRVVDETEDKARRALIKEYNKTYREWNNGARPSAEEIECRNDDINIYKMTFGAVEWT